jgi:hypothetical protein
MGPELHRLSRLDGFDRRHGVPVREAGNGADRHGGACEDAGCEGYGVGFHAGGANGAGEGGLGAGSDDGVGHGGVAEGVVDGQARREGFAGHGYFFISSLLFAFGLFYLNVLFAFSLFVVFVGR